MVCIINRLEIETRNRRMRVVYVTAIPSDVMGKHPCILESQWLLVPIPCRYQRENVFMFETSFFKQWPAHSCDLLAACTATRHGSERAAAGPKALAYLLKPIPDL